jgi:DNA-binding MarR family transcriptional regulator
MNAPPRSASPCVAAAMRAASRKLTLRYDEVMAPSGLRLTQFNVLAELARRAASPPTVHELADILTMERSALGQTLRPLERDGLVELGRDKQDGRRRPVRLTRAGQKAVARTRPYWSEAHGRFAKFFGEEAMAELRGTLRDIAENPRLDDAFDRGDAPH